jgi:hypothetical protein
MAAAFVEINKILVGALQHCDTKEAVEDTFTRFGFSDYPQKSEHLRMAMGEPMLFLSEGNVDTAIRYDTVLSMFLTGEWKINELYDRAGL